MRQSVNLVEFWKRFDVDVAPCVHEEDSAVLRACGRSEIDLPTLNFRRFLHGDRFGSFDQRFHLSLLPVPYVGDLGKADIFILLLNPSFGFSDYYAEEQPEFRKALVANLRQEVEDRDFPFVYLDPEFCWSGGFIWWEEKKKLRTIAQQIAARCTGGSYRIALRALSRRIAAVELVPYHSLNFDGHRFLDSLPSVKMARQFVQDELVPRAIKNDCLLIVTRRVSDWGFRSDSEPGRNIILYKQHEPRSASLGANSRGGIAILNWLKERWSLGDSLP